MKIEASISLRRRDEEVKVHGEPDCFQFGGVYGRTSIGCLTPN
jgi:hypothetical protein